MYSTYDYYFAFEVLGNIVLISFFNKQNVISPNQDKVHHSVLFPDESLVYIPPHDFGSTCSVLDLSLRLDKLFCLCCEACFPWLF